MSAKTEYAGRSTYTAAAQVGTFTPSGMAPELWQLRLSNDSGANVVFAVASVDEAGVSIAIDGSPFTIATGTGAQYDITSRNPTLTVTASSGASLGASNKAYAAVKCWSDPSVVRAGGYAVVAVA